MPAPVVIATLMRPHGDTGVQTHVQAFAEWLRGRGRAVQVLTPFDAPRALVLPTFALRRLIDPLHGGLSVWWYRHWHARFLQMALRRRLRGGEPCVVYAQCPLSADAAMRARAGPAQQVVMVVHFNLSQADEWAGKGRIAADGGLAASIRRFEAQVLPQLDGLVSVSAFMRAQLLARIPALAGVPGAIVPNFVADPGAPAIGVPPAGLQGDLLMVGALEPRKNQQYALQIVAAARRAGHPLRLTLAGDGPDRARLEALAQQLGISDLVAFAGVVPQAAAWFGRHRACLHVATLENLPVTLVEALSRGVPVFAAPVGGVPEVFDDGEQGCHLPLDDADEAARRVLQWLLDPAALRRAGALARQRFLLKFENGVAAQQLLAFLDGAAAERG